MEYLYVVIDTTLKANYLLYINHDVVECQKNAWKADGWCTLSSVHVSMLVS